MQGVPPSACSALKSPFIIKTPLLHKTNQPPELALHKHRVQQPSACSCTAQTLHNICHQQFINAAQHPFESMLLQTLRNTRTKPCANGSGPCS
jgi:hypothetical protein